MLTAVDVKLISLVYLYQEVLGDKGLFRSANILQMRCFKTIFRREKSKMFHRLFRHFGLTTKTTQPCPQVFLVHLQLRLHF